MIFEYYKIFPSLILSLHLLRSFYNNNIRENNFYLITKLIISSQ